MAVESGVKPPGIKTDVVRDPSLIPGRDARIEVLQNAIKLAESQGGYLEFESTQLYLLRSVPSLSVEESWDMASTQVFVNKGLDKPAFPWALPQEPQEE